MNFILKSQIWDLHIHTNKCPKGSSEFSKTYIDNTARFIDDLLKVFDETKYRDLAMISFTDHNQISLDVYKEFYNRKHRIKLLPGVEIDYLSDEKQEKTKHLIVYFDADEDNIEELTQKVNLLLEKTRNNGVMLTIQDLLRKLHEFGYNFLISPHAFKQEEKGLDFDWNEERFTKIDTKLYMDQFFCFWESAGLSSMSKAQKFLKDYEIDERISIVNFSDSNNFSKLINYLNYPSQYFHSLPSFKGLALVGSDATRISTRKRHLCKSDFSNFIGKVSFNDELILFSNHLNTIIGGRGSGKSVLLDSIALSLEHPIANEDRKKYLSKIDVKLFDFNDKQLSHDFKVEYYSQSYVSEIFNHEDFGAKLQEKFEDAFIKIPSINKSLIESTNKEMFVNMIADKKITVSENLKGLTNSYPNIINDGLDLSIKKGQKTGINKKDDLIDYVSAIENIDVSFQKIIPNQIIQSDVMKKIKDVIKYTVVLESNKYNERLIKDKYTANILIDNYFEYKDNKTEKSKNKKEHSILISNKIEYLSQDYIHRNSIVNAVIQSTHGFKEKIANYEVMHGSKQNRFIFSKELEIENPIDYFIRCVEKFFDKNNLRRRGIGLNISSFPQLAKVFVNNPELYLKESTTLKELIDAIKSFDLVYTSKSNIYYVDDDGSIKNIKQLSPGYQTNILMEYIVYRETEKPLLIDQPEDNVDNQTIYTQLKKWFLNLKFKRQVIVVTHDANIVINSDAENVIIANQEEENKFKYEYGALEFGNIIENAAIILDGGIDAVQRRLTKYES